MLHTIPKYTFLLRKYFLTELKMICIRFLFEISTLCIFMNVNLGVFNFQVKNNYILKT